MRAAFRLLGVIGVVLLVGSNAVAQIAANGSIRGYVRDQQGGVLPGASIVASSPDAPTSYTTVSDKDGYYRLLDLPPGQYTLTVELAGFAKFVRPGVIVRAGLNLGVQIELTVGGQAESVTVKADSPMLESKTAVNAFNVSGDFQRALPLSSRRNWSDFLLATPGVASYESGGTKAFLINGTPGGSHVYQVDGMDVMATRVNTHSFMQLSADAISDVQIKTSAIDASSPMGLGAIVELVSPSGTDSLAGAAGFLYQPIRWNDNNTPGGTAPTVLIRQGDMSLGGPIRRGRAWFFTAYRRVDNSSGVARTAQQLTNVRRAVPGFEPFDAQETGNYVFIKGAAQLASQHQLTLSYNRDYRSADSVSPSETGPFGRFKEGGPVFGARLSSVWGSSLTTRLLVSHNRKGTEFQRLADGPARMVHLGTIPQGGTLRGTGLIAVLDTTNTPQLTVPNTKRTASAAATFYRQTAFGSHELQAGVWAQPLLHDETFSTYAAHGFQLEEVVLSEDANAPPTFQPFHRVVYDNPTLTTSLVDSRDVAVYLQDAWRPTARLTVSAGVRIDLVKRRDRIFDEVLQDSTEVGPRFGVNYRLSESSVVRGNWGRVHENLAVNSVTGGSANAGLRDLYDLDLNGVFETTVITSPRTAQLSNRIIDLENFHQARADEWGLGYHQQLPGSVSIDTSFIRRAYKDRPVSIDTNPIYEGSVFRGFRDNTFAQITRLTKNIWNWPVYKGLDVRVTKQTNRAQFIIGYTRIWRHIEGTWVPNDPASIIQPGVFPNDRAIGTASGFDPNNSLAQNNMGFNAPWRDHNFMAAGTYVAPWGLMISGRYGFLSGIWSGPIITRLAAPDPAFGPSTAPLANGTGGQNPLNTALRFAFPTRGEGQFTLPGVHELNLRVARDFSLGRSKLNIALDGFNVTNEGDNTLNITGNTNVTFSPSYRMGTLPQPPRSGQVTVRVRF